MASDIWSLNAHSVGGLNVPLTGEDVEWSLWMMERFATTVFRPSLLDVSVFFEMLARVAQEVFSSNMVRIWDNSVHANCLVLLTSYPHCEVRGTHFTISRDESLTGLAIERCESVHIPDINKPTGRRTLQNPALHHSLGLQHLVSIPIFNPVDTQLISFVVDLYYDRDVKDAFFGEAGPFKNPRTISWMTRTLGRSLDYLLYRIGADVVRTIESASSSVVAFARFLEAIFPELTRYTHCDGAEVYRLDPISQTLVLEHSVGLLSPTKEIAQADLTGLLYAQCIERSRPLILPGQSSHGSDTPDHPVFMATPIPAPSGEPLGVLCAVCDKRSQWRRSFSSLDVHILGEFARAVGSILERFIRVRESAFMVRVAKDVSETLVGTQDLSTILQRTLAAVVRGLNAGVGSIYLLEDVPNYPPRLVLRAAIGPQELMKLIGEAYYEVGKGITGTIAEGHVVNFKSWDECRNHPRWLGKYDTTIWQVETERVSNTLLGVPIQLGNRLLGVWKIENAAPGQKHPDPYFTDEDVQVLRVLSTFLAYMIEHNRYKAFMSEELRQLAQSSIEIEQARNEDDAILAVLSALERLGFQHPRLWLYDQATGQLRSVIDLSRERIKASESGHLLELLNSAVESVSVSRTEDGHFALPVRLDDELIGVLEINLGHRSGMRDDETMLLKGFAGHIGISLSRLRNARRVLELTKEVLGSSRFVVAETLSSMAVHSLRHLMGTIIESLEQDLKKPAVRDREQLLGPLTAWHKKLSSGMQDLNNALLVVKSEEDTASIDAHPVLLSTIEMWYGYITQHKCRIDHDFSATDQHCFISRAALKEIVSVLTVNSVQAHAKRISIRSYNERDVSTPTNFVELAWTMEFSDDGDGLASNTPDDIFSASYTTKNSDQGTGLGLFIAKSLARNCGGDLVVVADKRSRGVTFRLTIPAQRAEAQT